MNQGLGCLALFMADRRHMTALDLAGILTAFQGRPVSVEQVERQDIITFSEGEAELQLAIQLRRTSTT
jgi:hypothetical protein